MASQIVPAPTPARLVTWNTQGNPNDQSDSGLAKSIEIAKLLADDGDGSTLRVIFVQEGGSKLSNYRALQPNYTVFAGRSVGAFNERCTTYIVTNAGEADEVTIVDAGDGVIMAGGLAGRTACAMSIGRTLFISWHATASNMAASSSDLFVALFTSPFYAKRYDVIVVGGDFNYDPDELKTWFFLWEDKGTQPGDWQRPNASVFHAEVRDTGQGTQGGPTKDLRELDYFVVFTRKDGVKRIGDAVPVLVPVDPSDHNPVRMTCDMLL